MKQVFIMLAIHSMHNMCLCSIKTPLKSAHTVGFNARTKAKLGAILDQVHSDLVTEKNKGQS